MKQEAHRTGPALGLIVLAGFIVSVGCSLSAHGQEQPTPAPTMNTDTMAGEEHEVAHPFFTHMGMPEGVGVYNLRLGALVTSADGEKEGDVAFHAETGLTKVVGVHLRNDGIVNSQHTELMFQFAAVGSKDGMSGFAPLIEFEFPTHSGGDQHINTLVGFSTALATSKAAFNQVVHYDPRTDLVEGSAAYVVKLGRRWFPVVELSGEGMQGERPVINLLGGMKILVKEGLYLGMAAQAPVTGREDFSWQLVLQPDIEWGKKK